MIDLFTNILYMLTYFLSFYNYIMNNIANLTFSTSAKKQMHKLIKAENNPNLALRVSVTGGGCSGFQYHFDFAKKIIKDDLHIMCDQQTLGVIDQQAHELLKDSQIDFVDELGGSYFKINNPNAANTCGCGSSFSI